MVPNAAPPGVGVPGGPRVPRGSVGLGLAAAAFELWDALVEAKREYNRRQADFHQNAQDRTGILKSALTGEPWRQATALSFLGAFAPDHADLLPQLVNLSLSRRWVLAARQAIDRVPRVRLWPALTPVIDAQLQTTDPDDLRRLAELLAHIQAWPMLNNLVSRARDIGDPEAREVADDFTGKYGALFGSPPPESGPNP